MPDDLSGPVPGWPYVPQWPEPPPPWPRRLAQRIGAWADRHTTVVLGLAAFWFSVIPGLAALTLSRWLHGWEWLWLPPWAAGTLGATALLNHAVVSWAVDQRRQRLREQMRQGRWPR